jgi:hypothetical protein
MLLGECKTKIVSISLNLVFPDVVLYIKLQHRSFRSLAMISKYAIYCHIIIKRRYQGHTMRILKRHTLTNIV